MQSRVSAMATFTLCVKSFQATGVEISLQDIDISRRPPTKSTTPGNMLIICKFSRRLMKEQVVNCRREVSKVSPDSLGLSGEVSLSEAVIYDHLTPKTQKLLIDAKKFQVRHHYSYCCVSLSTDFLF